MKTVGLSVSKGSTMINDQSPFAKQTQPFKAIALSARDSPAREKPHAAQAGLRGRGRGRSSVFCQFLCFSCKTYEIIHIHTFQLFTPRVSLPRKEGKKEWKLSSTLLVSAAKMQYWKSMNFLGLFFISVREMLSTKRKLM